MQKKIIISLSSAIVFFVIILLLMGCNKSNSIKIDKDDLCIIEKNRITGNSFIRCYSEKLKSLKTINIEEKNLGSVDCKTKIVTIENTKLYLQIWDTAGTESFNSITRSFFKTLL